jgi:hypothetical protein
MMSYLQINLSYLYYMMIVVVIIVIKKLCDDSSIIYMAQVDHKLDIVSSNPISCTEIRTSIL